MNLRLIVMELLQDRAVQFGAGTSSVSLAGAAGVQHHHVLTLAEIQPWVAFFAAFFGGLSALATFIYVSLKIRRMLKNPKSLD